MYETPIRILYGSMQSQIEGDVLKAIHHYEIQVDKDELIRALAYDRDQYDRGFADGKADVVYCWVCAHRIGGLCRHPAAPEGVFLQTEDRDSCSYGIKEEEEGDSE